MTRITEAVVEERRLNTIRYIEQCTVEYKSMPGEVPGCISNAVQILADRGLTVESTGFLPKILRQLDYNTTDSALGATAAMAIRNLMAGDTPMVEVQGYQPGDVPF